MRIPKRWIRSPDPTISLCVDIPALDRSILTSPFERAGYRFAIKTLLRSERHGLVLGGSSRRDCIAPPLFRLTAVDCGGQNRPGSSSSKH